MGTKKLFVIIRNLGDGSSCAQYTFDESYILRMQEAEVDGTLEDSYMDSDGFHFTTLNVPEECTYASLGVYNCAQEMD